MKHNSSRRIVQLFSVTTIMLLAAVLIIVAENNRKYAESLSQIATDIVTTNRAQMRSDQTATMEAFYGGLRTTLTAAMASTQTAMPYDPTIYWARQTEPWLLMTAGGPTDYAIFYATETALRATGWQTATPSAQPGDTP